jgi:hypothetical protein
MSANPVSNSLLAFEVKVVVFEQHVCRPREARQRGQHLGEAFLDALCDRDLAFAVEQFDRAHLAHVHAHRIGGAARFRIKRRQRSGCFLSGGVVDTRRRWFSEQQLDIRRDLVHLDTHAIDHADDVFDLIRIDEIVGQVIVDLGIGQVALLETFADELLDLGFLLLSGIRRRRGQSRCHVYAAESRPSIIS